MGMSAADLEAANRREQVANEQMMQGISTAAGSITSALSPVTMKSPMKFEAYFF